MNKQQEALKLALEALKQIDEAMPFPVAKFAQAAIRDALDEKCVCGEPDTPGTHRTDGPCLAEQPASKPWVGLTDEELKPLVQKAMMYYGYNPEHWSVTSGAGFCILSSAIEAKLREKNA